LSCWTAVFSALGSAVEPAMKPSKAMPLKICHLEL
jgi:hypothetical protein